MFTGKEDQSISLEVASDMTKAFRAAHPDQILGEYFSKKILLEILSQENCVGIRRYNAIGADGQSSVIVGVLENEDDMVDGVLGDRSVKSPPFGGSSNSLNS